MADFLFYLFAALTVGAALLVVVSRNAVNAAMFLLLSFTGLAALFALLGAYFLAVLQVFVYAGAVVVLFLFVIMLLDVRAAARRPFKVLTVVASLVGFLLLLAGASALFLHRRVAPPPLPAGPAVGANLKSFGELLYTTYLLPLEVTGFLLLIAMLGVIVLSKKYAAAKT